MIRVLLSFSLIDMCTSTALPMEFVTTHPQEQSLREVGILKCDTNYIQFNAKGEQDADLFFDNHKSRVILGGWGNSKSILQFQNRVPNMDEYHGQVLERNTYKSFWISWNRSHMYVGKGNISGHNIILHGISEYLPDTFDIRLHSSFGKTVNWVINDADQDYWLLHTDLNCDNTSTTTIGSVENATYVPTISPSTQKTSNIFTDTDSTSTKLSSTTLNSSTKLSSTTLNSSTKLSSTTLNSSTKLSSTTLNSSTKLSSTTLNSACECPCSELGNKDTTEFLIEEQEMSFRKRLEELEHAIRINPKTTSKYRGTRISAADDRVSSKVIGCIGAFIICLFIGIVVLFDAIRFWHLRY